MLQLQQYTLSYANSPKVSKLQWSHDNNAPWLLLLSTNHQDQWAKLSTKTNTELKTENKIQK